MPHIMSFSERMLKSSIQILLTILYYRSYVNAGVRQSNKIHYLSVTSYIHVENSSNQFLITFITNDILKLLKEQLQLYLFPSFSYHIIIRHFYFLKHETFRQVLFGTNSSPLHDKYSRR